MNCGVGHRRGLDLKPDIAVAVAWEPPYTMDVALKSQKKWINYFSLYNRYFIYIYIILGAAPVAYGSFQARGQIRASAVSLCHSHSNVRSQPHL